MACSTITGTTVPTWIADPVVVELQPGVPVSISFALRRADEGGEVTVVSDFPEGQAVTIDEFPIANAGWSPQDRTTTSGLRRSPA